MIRRLHLVELEDLEWFPKWIRDYATDYLRFIGKLLYPFEPLEERVARLMRDSDIHEIVDLCSGGAGPLVEFTKGLENHGIVLEKVTVTDKYPNIPAFSYVAGQSEGKVSFTDQSIDATNVPDTFPGLRTLFNSFHHFPPTLAKSILQNAVDQRAPIVVAELVERRMAIPSLLGGGIFAFFMAPFVKPFSVGRLLSFWVLPVVPLLVMWDGFVSCLRIYSPPELKELVEELDNTDNYTFEMGIESVSPFLPRVTYLIGHPT